jgi:FAD:protein FMN transferase
VGVSPRGKVLEVAVMEYRESRGSEVKERRFLSQFRGKTSSDPIRVNQDIVNYTGATLSSYAIARGVRRALALTHLFYGTAK